ncbi:MAG: hypothetical protein WC623_24635 [Pedobacter sp.]|uniref:hypothetical protein n=1 Tax=Pedobacter sp. TaxID=1411316 RepID=UPI00356A7C89
MIESKIDDNIKEEIVSFFSTHVKYFKSLVSYHYCVSNNLLEKYKDEWDWHYLSTNESLLWSLELLEKYKDNWNWKV